LEITVSRFHGNVQNTFLQQVRTKSSLMITLLFVMITPFFLCSCKDSNEAKKDKPTYAFVINASARFWDLAHAGCQKACREVGATLDFQVPGLASAAQQKQIVETLIAKNCNGIAISPLSPDSMGRVIDMAAEFMPIICQDSDAAGSKRVCYIGTDNVAAGRAAGEEMKKAMPNGGEIALFVGKLDVANAAERKQGIEEALTGSKIIVVETFTDETDRMKAQVNVRTAIAKYPNLKGVMGLWAYNGPAIVKVLREAPERNIKVVCFDEDFETLEAVRSGEIYSTIVQNPYEFGYQSMIMLNRIHTGQPVDIPDNKLIFVPVRVINNDNVDSLQKDIEEKLGSLEKGMKHF
jgi:ribose transport system substrate-binding protein